MMNACALSSNDNFILQIDHKPFLALLQTEYTKGFKPTTAALKRWVIKLLEYDFKIEYIRTQDFGQADALSRFIEKFRLDNLENFQVASICLVENKIKQIRDSSIDKFGSNFPLKLKTATNEDPDLKSIMEVIRNNKILTQNFFTVNYYIKRLYCCR